MRKTADEAQSDFIDLLKDYFSKTRIIPGLSQSGLTYNRDEENDGTIKIRASVSVQRDTSEDIPIIAVSHDDDHHTVLGFNQGEVEYDFETATSTRMSLVRIPIYINSICSNDLESDRLASHLFDLMEMLKPVFLSKKGYHDMVFQSKGKPSIIRYVGPGEITYATPIAGYVDIVRLYTITEKAKTMTEMSSFTDGQHIWNGGTTDG